MEKTIQQLEVELRQKKEAEFQRIRKEQNDKEEVFRKLKKISVYTSDDYCGMSCGDYSFYYGYEVTRCPVKSHKDDDDCYEKDCDRREWCFVATHNGKEVLMLPTSELLPKQDEPYAYLLSGIGQFLQSLTTQ
jgi:hypothetical protein